MVKQFSKKILVADYVIAIALMVVFCVTYVLSGIFGWCFDFSTFAIVLGTWIGQLGVTSGAYYILIKSEHKIELPIMLLNDLPEDIKNQIDMTTVITTVLTCTDN